MKSVSMNEIQREHLEGLLNSYESVFNNKNTRANVYEHNIVVNEGENFVRKTYPIPIHYQQQIDYEIIKMINKGVIETADSVFLDPMVVVKKRIMKCVSV